MSVRRVRPPSLVPACGASHVNLPSRVLDRRAPNGRCSKSQPAPFTPLTPFPLVTEARIVSTHRQLFAFGDTSIFSGLAYGNIYTLDNRQIWEQTDPYIHLDITVMPDVIIWKDGSFCKMKVEGIDMPVTVQQVQ